MLQEGRSQVIGTYRADGSVEIIYAKTARTTTIFDTKPMTFASKLDCSTSMVMNIATQMLRNNLMGDIFSPTQDENKDVTSRGWKEWVVMLDEML